MSAANVAAASARVASAKPDPAKSAMHLLCLNRLNNKRMKQLLTKLNRLMLLHLLRQAQQQRSACPKSLLTICLSLNYRMWRNLQACSGSTPTRSGWRKSKRPLRQNRARCMYRVSVRCLWCWTTVR